ncbi:alpha/beta fold hydrolase [Neptunicella marina]|uniref:Alpha/beta hydrolase n=1 Tax=Neptunicella marina TaxID=2125989 RepID=A0A8J6M3S7_9ALTE|nr:alpha/beta hydrolase [Neptunicella marina]MBC3767798.1 alpha/beta hydrolase [Neptunicella marina]
MTLAKYGLLLLLLFTNSSIAQLHQTFSYLNEDKSTRDLHYSTWGSESNPVVLLLSGPIATWHSDSAIWAKLAPMLAEKFYVIALDRVSVVNEFKDGGLGYVPFSDDIKTFVLSKNLTQFSIVSFASSNLTVVSLAPQVKKRISKVILLDPDVLTPQSITRYQKDTQPFKDNQQQYAEYIQAGKYIPRVEQKNQMELEEIKTIIGSDNQYDRNYFAYMQSKRLLVQNQLNLFKEIPIYAQELSLAENLKLPTDIPLIIVDSQFESQEIEQAKTEEQKQSLVDWQKDAKAYYQRLTNEANDGRYIESQSLSHMLPFSEAELIKSLL